MADFGDWTRIKRKLLPVEEVDVSGDEVLRFDEELLVTSWVPASSRMGVARARSFFFLDRCWCATEKFDGEGRFKYWYCDLLHVERDAVRRRLVLTDLVVDVVVFPDGTAQVVDLPELDRVRADGLFEARHEASLRRGMADITERLLARAFPPAEMADGTEAGA